MLPIKQIISYNIMRFAGERGFNKADLAARAKVSNSTISDITNSGGNPSLETLVAISDALSVPVIALFEPPPGGLEGMDGGALDALWRKDAKRGAPPGHQRVLAIVTDHQAFQVRKWHAATQERLRLK